MFESKLDKAMCFFTLHLIGVVFGVQEGSVAYYPFAAVATLVIGLSVAPSAEKE